MAADDLDSTSVSITTQDFSMNALLDATWMRRRR